MKNAISSSAFTFVALAAIGLLRCSSADVSSGASKDTGADGSAPGSDGGVPLGDAGLPQADASVCGTTTAGEVPSAHRPSPVTCTPGTNPDVPDADVQSCTTTADCTYDAGLPNATVKCLQGRCLYDSCLTDSDCRGGQACSCASDYYGGNANVKLNVCVPANCHVDSDCGAGGYCSPSLGYCGTYQGFYCHTKKDTCVDPTKDCASCGAAGNACTYSPAAGSFTCGSSVCNG